MKVLSFFRSFPSAARFDIFDGSLNTVISNTSTALIPLTRIIPEPRPRYLKQFHSLYPVISNNSIASIPLSLTIQQPRHHYLEHHSLDPVIRPIASTPLSGLGIMITHVALVLDQHVDCIFVRFHALGISSEVK